MNKNLTSINQNAKSVLSKSKSLLNVTNSLLSKKANNDLARNFQFKPYFSDGDSSNYVINISPDGKTFLSSGSDRNIKLWDITNGNVIRTFRKTIATGLISEAIAINPDGKTFLTGGIGDNTLELWNIETGELLRIFKGDKEYVTSIEISIDGKIALSVSFNSIKLWNIETGEVIRTFEKVHASNTKTVTTSKISKDCKTIVFTGSSGYIQLWNIETGEYIETLDYLDFIDFNEIEYNSKTLYAENDHKDIYLFDLSSGQLIRTFKGHNNGICSIEISPDCKTLLSGSADSTLKLWDIESGQLIRTFKGHERYVESVKFVPNSRTIFSIGSGTIRQWDKESGKLIKILKGHTNSDYIDNIIVNSNNKVVFKITDGTFKLWDILSGKIVQIFEDYTTPILYVAMSIDGKTVFSGSKDNTLKLWDIETGEVIRTFGDHENKITSFAINHENKIILSDGTIKIWDIQNKKFISTTYSIKDGSTITILQDGYFNASEENIDKFLRVNDTAMSCRKLTESEMKHFCKIKYENISYTNYLHNSVYSPNGKIIAYNQGDKIILRDRLNGNFIREFLVIEAYSIKFSPCSQKIAFIQSSILIILIDINTKQEKIFSVEDDDFIVDFSFDSNGENIIIEYYWIFREEDEEGYVFEETIEEVAYFNIDGKKVNKNSINKLAIHGFDDNEIPF